MNNDINRKFDILLDGLKESDVSFAKNLFTELNLIEPNMITHSFLIAIYIANDNKSDLNEKKLAQVIIKIYKDNYKKILQTVGHKSIPEVVAVNKIVELVMKNKHLYEDCEIKVVPRT